LTAKEEMFCYQNALHFNTTKNMITVEKYSEDIGIPAKVLLGRSRKYPVASARDAYWLYMRQNRLRHAEIAAMFNRSRSTVISGINTAKNLISTEEKWPLFCYGKLSEDV
jgi:chromosomal replication initiation ATPase DnaA